MFLAPHRAGWCRCRHRRPRVRAGQARESRVSRESWGAQLMPVRAAKARAAMLSLCILYAAAAYSSAMRWSGYAWALGATAACTAAGVAMRGRFDLVNIAMVYLLAVVIVALRFSRGAAVATSVLSIVMFDVLFVPPQGLFTVDDVQYLLTFAIMLAVGLIISGLVESVRRQASAQAGAEAAAQT